MAPKILVVDDEAAIREMIGFTLSQAGMHYLEAADVDQAETIMERESPELILLDWMLPGRSGIEFARHLRRSESHRSIPIIMLTARGEQEDKVRGLTIGADDYITKPFGPKELVARIGAVLRRVRPDATQDMISLGGLALDPTSHRVLARDRILSLAPTEFRLLQVLIRHPDRAYTRAQLLDLVWGHNLHVGERTVDMHISNIRKALEEHDLDHMIQTVRGVGYRLSLGN